MSKKQFYVKCITGDTQVISIPNNDPLTIYDLKKMINEDEPYMLRLLHKNQELEDEQFLNETQLQNCDTIYFMMKLNREVEILLEIKKKMNIQLNWRRDLDLSEWEFIEIDNESDSKFKVTILYLSYMNLTGEIPREIGKLANLQRLHLCYNQLTGEIPREIGKLGNLIWLHLHYNQLTGEIPREIGKLGNLQRLDLDNNQLTGEIPREIGKLGKLESLSLENNQLTGEITREIGKLGKLFYFNFDKEKRYFIVKGFRIIRNLIIKLWN